VAFPHAQAQRRRAAAALVGFLGNEGVAVFRIRVGNEIGSAALRADGLHARADGFTSLAVLLGVLGVALGFPSADPLVGILITIAILFVLKDATVTMWRRLMDTVDPAMVDTIERTANSVPGVQSIHNVQVRWVGHQLSASLHIVVDAQLSVAQSHDLTQEVRHALFHRLPHLSEIIVHADPDNHSARELDSLTAHHEGGRAGEAAISSREQANPTTLHSIGGVGVKAGPPSVNHAATCSAGSGTLRKV
jgi:cation diffusion facilitator family transporter